MGGGGGSLYQLSNGQAHQEQGHILSSYLTRFLHTAGISNVKSPLPHKVKKDGEFYASLTNLCSCFRTQGAAVDPKSDERRTPLFRAADKGAADVVKLLMDRGADVTIRDTELQSVLHAAVGHPRAMEVLLQVRLPHRKTSSLPWGHPRAMEGLLTADKE